MITAAFVCNEIEVQLGFLALFLAPASPDAGRQRVRESKAAGWGFIKSYSLLSEPTHFAIADEGRRERLPL